MPEIRKPSNQDDVNVALRAWGGGEVIHQLHGGHRNLAFLVRVQGHLRVAKTTRRSEIALQWLMPVYEVAEQIGLVVPKLIRSQQGRLIEQGWTLETFLEGEPAKPEHLARLAPLVKQFHKLTANLPQRPGFGSSQQLIHQTTGGDVDLTAMPTNLVDVCRNHWRAFSDRPQAIVHGDLNLNNILVTADNTLALVDWDEARRDLTCFDNLVLQRQQGKTLATAEVALLDAWEVAVSWQVEPEHARQVSQRLY
ncbi:MAG: phosphotransferase [Deinococcota bacterium]